MAYDPEKEDVRLQAAGQEVATARITLRGDDVPGTLELIEAAEDLLRLVKTDLTT